MRHAAIPAFILLCALSTGCDKKQQRQASADPSLAQVPSKVWEGGNPVTIDIDTSDAASLSLDFASGNGLNDNNPKYVYVKKELEAGHHSFTIEVPPQTQVTSEVDIRPSTVHKGSAISLVMKRGSQVIAHDDIEMDHDHLEAKRGFFAQLEVENAGG